MLACSITGVRACVHGSHHRFREIRMLTCHTRASFASSLQHAEASVQREIRIIN